MNRFYLTIKNEVSGRQHLTIDIPLDFVPDTDKLNTVIMTFLAKEQKRIAEEYEKTPGVQG